MRIRELELWLWSVERMRFGQLPFQILFVHLLLVSVLVHVQVEGFAQWEVLLVGQVRGGEIVFVHRFCDA